MPAFLQKIDSGIEWRRCFPAVDKQAPKLNRPLPTPRLGPSHGATGRHLVERMLGDLREFYRGPNCPFDLVVLIDDADCRFPASRDELSRWALERHEEVREATDKPDIEFLALLAFPEVEAWLLADWNDGFGKQYRQTEVPLRRHLQSALLAPSGLDWDRIEEYGGALRNGTCERKLSSDLQGAIGSEFAGCRYSKKIDGAAMLMRVRPAIIANVCPLFRSSVAIVNAADNSA